MSVPARSDRAAPNSPVEERAIAAFVRSHGSAPLAIASAPGRVNLIGDHTDYAGGLVLPMAIEERTAVALSPSADARTRIESIELGARAVVESPAAFEPRAPDAPDAWTNFVMGPLRMLADGALAPGPVPLPALSISVASDVPIGAGLSSSASLATATATAALALARRSFGHWALVRLLQAAEARFAGTPCGIMDMTVALTAAPGAALLIDCGVPSIEPVPLPEALALLLVDSGIRHRLTDGGYAERRRELALAATDPRFEPRSRHVRTENERVRRAVAALRAGDVRALGAIAFESHDSLRHDFEVSVPGVDRIVDLVREGGAAHGALGARMTGGGFGGNVVVFVERARIDGARAFLHGALASLSGVRIREVRPGHRYTSRIERGAP